MSGTTIIKWSQEVGGETKRFHPSQSVQNVNELVSGGRPSL